jgi:Xaa-Pro dipeptidase
MTNNFTVKRFHGYPQNRLQPIREGLTMNFSDRHRRLARELTSNEIDAACILKPHNVFYVAGYAPVCAGIIAFPDSDPVYCTLWLDAPEAKRFCAMANLSVYIFPRQTLMSKLIEIILKRKPSPKKIGVEKDFIVLRDYEMLSASFSDVQFLNITPAVDQLRAIKSEEEIEMIRKSASISDKGMEAALKAVQPGVSELDIAAEAEYVMKRLGSEKTAFSTFVASGERTLLAHPIASRRQIKSGEPVVVDLGATWSGYASDICRTTFAGEPTPQQAEYLTTIVKAQEAASSVIREGIPCQDVYEAAYRVFDEYGLSKYLPDDIGYGVGLRQSEFYPVIEKGSLTILKENMVVALLQTTSYSKKMGGLRVEDTFRVTKTVCEKLTRTNQPHFRGA